MAAALRSRLRLSSIASRNGSQKLVDRARFGSFGLESLNSTPNPVVTSFSLAGFAVSAFAFPLVERSSVLVLAGFVASDPVVTSLAGFAGGRRPHSRGRRTPIPAARREAPAVSRRTPVSGSMSSSRQPTRPSARAGRYLAALTPLP